MVGELSGNIYLARFGKEPYRAVEKCQLTDAAILDIHAKTGKYIKEHNLKVK